MVCKKTHGAGMIPGLSLLSGLVAIAATVPVVACAQATEFQSEHHAYRAVTIVEGLSNPWGLAFLPGGDMLVTERSGALRRIRDGVLLPDPISGVPAAHVNGQGGLLDVALHPRFSDNGLVYLSHSKARADGEASTALVRGRLDGERLVDVEELFVADAWTGRGVHFGSRIVFDSDSTLFLSVGDRGEMQEAQNTLNHQGTILRLTDEGGVPADNPFVGRDGFRPEIYTWGNRSPQGLAIHPATGELWESEHGPRGGDELNRLLPGRNYGWPTITYGINYDGSTISEHTEMAGMEQPVHYWVPSIATSGLAFYEGDAFPEWRGNAFVGGLAGAQLARIVLDGSRSTSEETLLEGFAQRIRTVVTGPDGYLYLLIDTANAPLVRLEPR